MATAIAPGTTWQRIGRIPRPPLFGDGGHCKRVITSARPYRATNYRLAIVRRPGGGLYSLAAGRKCPCHPGATHRLVCLIDDTHPCRDVNLLGEWALYQSPL